MNFFPDIPKFGGSCGSVVPKDLNHCNLIISKEPPRAIWEPRNQGKHFQRKLTYVLTYRVWVSKAFRIKISNYKEKHESTK